jgi:hypothetical protein
MPESEKPESALAQAADVAARGGTPDDPSRYGFSSGESPRVSIERARRVSDERERAAGDPPPPAPQSPSGHHSASSDATWTGRFLDYLGLGFLLGPPELLLGPIVRGEAVNWTLVIVSAIGCWTVGGFLLAAGLTWPKWKPENETCSANLGKVGSCPWGWCSRSKSPAKRAPT